MELGVDLGYSSYGEVHAAMAAGVAAFVPVAEARAVRREGVVIAHPVAVRITAAATSAAPRLNHQFRLLVSRVLYDQAVSTSQSPSLAPLARDAGIHLHSSDALRLGVREGSDLRVAANGSAVVLPLVIDDAVSRGVAFVPFNQHGNDIRVLIRHDVPVIDLVIEVI